MQAQRGQAALERKVAVLEAHQLEVHNVLCSLEDEAQRLYRVPPCHGLCWAGCTGSGNMPWMSMMAPA